VKLLHFFTKSLFLPIWTAKNARIASHDTKIFCEKFHERLFLALLVAHTGRKKEFSKNEHV
jgi:hypothetical protein